MKRILTWMGLMGGTGAEEIRGVKDCDLPKVSDGKLIMMSIARTMEAIGVDDIEMIHELYRRSKP